MIKLLKSFQIPELIKSVNTLSIAQGHTSDHNLFSKIDSHLFYQRVN